MIEKLLVECSMIFKIDIFSFPRKKDGYSLRHYYVFYNVSLSTRNKKAWFFYWKIKKKKAWLIIDVYDLFNITII